MNFSFNLDGLLVASYGVDDCQYKWSYSDFEKHLNECITPSMYHFMANYVAQNMSLEDQHKILRGEYIPGRLESEAVDAYWE